MNLGEIVMSETQPVTRRVAAPAGGAAAAAGGQRRLGLALLVIATAQLMVVLDATIVNVALPHIQRALGFSGSGLEWVVNAYALAFGGLLLLGGRAGDLLGRRKMFIAGLLVFSAASLAGGFATSQAWLLAARAIQGVGGAIIAPAALSLVTTTFPEGPPRNRAMGVYAAMSVGRRRGRPARRRAADHLRVLAVGAVRQRAHRHRRGIGRAAGARRVGPQPRPVRPARRGHRHRRGRRPGLRPVQRRPPAPDGVSHWADTKVVASLAASVVLLAAFAVIEARSRHALLPVRLLRDRNRTGAYLIMFGVGTAIFGMLFFLTVFMQDRSGDIPR